MLLIISVWNINGFIRYDLRDGQNVICKIARQDYLQL